MYTLLYYYYTWLNIYIRCFRSDFTAGKMFQCLGPTRTFLKSIFECFLKAVSHKKEEFSLASTFQTVTSYIIVCFLQFLSLVSCEGHDLKNTSRDTYPLSKNENWYYLV
jgi:hypothetical protein